MPKASRRTLLVAAALAPLLTAVGCGDDEPEAVAEQERPLSGEEAELLALTRFRLHQEEEVPVRMELPGADGSTIEATLALAAGTAWGTATFADAPDRVIAWSTKVVATAAVPEDGAAAPGRADWTTRAVGTGVVQDLFLLLALTLGSDRPENPVLLQQGSARFLRHDEVDGTPVTVMSGPRPADEGADATGSRTRYWVDDDGGLRRFEAYLGAADGSFATLTRVGSVPEVPELDARAAEVLRIAAGGRA